MLALFPNDFSKWKCYITETTCFFHQVFVQSVSTYVRRVMIKMIIVSNNIIFDAYIQFLYLCRSLSKLVICYYDGFVVIVSL